MRSTQCRRSFASYFRSSRRRHAWRPLDMKYSRICSRSYHKLLLRCLSNAVIASYLFLITLIDSSLLCAGVWFLCVVFFSACLVWSNSSPFFLKSGKSGKYPRMMRSIYFCITRSCKKQQKKRESKTLRLNLKTIASDKK